MPPYPISLIGDQNLADLPSRGCSPEQYLQSKWWEDPTWLYGKPNSWPTHAVNLKDQEAEIKAELLNTKTVNVHISHNESHPFLPILNPRISNYLQRNCSIGRISCKHQPTAKTFLKHAKTPRDNFSGTKKLRKKNSVIT